MANTNNEGSSRPQSQTSNLKAIDSKGFDKFCKAEIRKAQTAIKARAKAEGWKNTPEAWFSILDSENCPNIRSLILRITQGGSRPLFHKTDLYGCSGMKGKKDTLRVYSLEGQHADYLKRESSRAESAAIADEVGF